MSVTLQSKAYALIDAADAAVHCGMPTHFLHDDRTYWVRVVQPNFYVLEVFDSPTTRFPVAHDLITSIEGWGHNPCLAEPQVQNVAAFVKDPKPTPCQLDQVQPVDRSFCSDWAALMAKGSAL